MTEYIVRLNRNFTDDIGNYFTKRNCTITYSDSVLKDMLFIKTDLSLEEINNLEHIAEARLPRTGRIDI